MKLSMTIEGSGLEKFDNTTRALSRGEIGIIAKRALNHTGAKARTQVTRALTAQTGLKRKVIVAALKVTKASGARLDYQIRSTGGDVSLKFFDPKETDDGVSASPFGKRTVFVGSFLSGGQWPHGRKGLIAGGHAFYRAGAKRYPIKVVNSGVVIPAEMIKGATADAFMAAAQQLPDRIAHEMSFSRDLQTFTKGAAY